MTARLLLAAAGVLLTGACSSLPGTPPALSPVTTVAPAPAEQRAPVTILVSIDGFRPDYLQRGATPVLSRLAAEGVSASMMPSFPSKTFPNHWTLVTGLVPDHHGIVGNTMEDPSRPGEKFTMATDDPFWWSGAEPIWVTAEKAGQRTATEFWPGSNVGLGGTRERSGDATVGGGAPRRLAPLCRAGDQRSAHRCGARLVTAPSGVSPTLPDAVFRRGRPCRA